MREDDRHLTDIELAQLDEEAADQELRAHIERCPRCRRVAADYGWVEGEIAAALQAKADAAPMPERSWHAIRGRLAQAERRGARGRLMAVSGVALVVSALMIAPWLLDTGLGDGGTSPAPVVTAPAPPATAGVVTRIGDARAEDTILASVRPSGGSEMPVPFGPPPTPPENQG